LKTGCPGFNKEETIATIDILRPIKGIQGFTREIVVALVANCESLELRREDSRDQGVPPEDPRASSTDDVEGFIALLHDQLGDVFDHKAFLSQQPRFSMNLVKKLIQTCLFTTGLDTDIGTLIIHCHQALLKDWTGSDYRDVLIQGFS